MKSLGVGLHLGERVPAGAARVAHAGRAQAHGGGARRWGRAPRCVV